MAKDSSFDVVSEVDAQEVTNAYQQTTRELSSRYDLKQTASTLDFDKQTMSFVSTAPSAFVSSQVVDVLRSKLAKRGIDLSALRIDEATPSGTQVKQQIRLVQGIDKEIAKKISKDIRDTKKKCKVSVEGEKLKVSSASKDTLQEIISFLKDMDYGQPLQFTNYR